MKLLFGLVSRNMYALFFILLFSTSMLAQQQRNEAIAAPKALIPPKITCVLTTQVDSFIFRNNVYVPTNFSVKVCVTNIDTAYPATNVLISLVSNTRFIILPPSTKLVADTLKVGQTVCDSFQLIMTTRLPDDGMDTIRAVVTTSNGGSSVCEKAEWVEHEHKPAFTTVCDAPVKDMLWDDATEDYSPNPFVVNFTVYNRGDNDADSTQVLLILPKGLSPDISNAPIKDIGTLKANEQKVVSFNVHAVKTNIDTDDTIWVQVQGKGGLGNRIILDTCRIIVHRQAARQAQYDITCNYLPDSVKFINHKYSPDTLVYKIDVKNIGTADGVNVQAQILPPPSILVVGNAIKNLGNLAKDTTANWVWKLIPKPRAKLDTSVICVRVWDKFNNSDTCCDAIIIDSVRCGVFGVTVICPDTIRVDTLNGVYINNPFPIKFKVQNIGTDFIDSLRATLSISDADVVSLTNKTIITDTLYVGEDTTFTWILKAYPRAVGASVTLTMTVETMQGSCTDKQSIECRVFVMPLAAPNLKALCFTDPPDTVRFNPMTGKYEPEMVTYSVIVQNNGGAPAEEVCLIPYIPPGFILAPGEDARKCIINPVTLTSKDTISWKLIPLPRRDHGLLAIFCADITSKNASTEKCCASVYVQELPHISAIAITQDNVGYYTQEIKVPVTIDNSDDKCIKNIEFEVAYDHNIVSFIRPDQTGTLLGSWVPVTAINRPGNQFDTLIINAVNVNNELSGAGILLYLWFKAEFGAPPNHLQIAASDLKFITAPLPSAKPIFKCDSTTKIYVRTTDGKVTVSGECLRPLEASDKYIISQNRPNPFNPVTVIDYAVPEGTHVRIDVIDALGRTITTLVNETKLKGVYQVTFDGSKVPSGMYFYRMDTPKFTKVMKMILAK